MNESFTIPTHKIYNQRQGDHETALSKMSDHHEFLISNLNAETPTLNLIKVLSSEEIVKVVATQYVRGSTNHGGIDSCFVGPARATEDQYGLELAHLLFTSADCISNKRYDQAARLLAHCRNISSQRGSPIERLSFYFCGALQERIERLTSPSFSNLLNRPPPKFAFNFNSGYDKAEFNQVMAYYYSVMPFVKLTHLTSVQAILDAVGDSTKIHVIDLDIRNGCQWSVLMESLAARQSSNSFNQALKDLKITAIGTDGDDLRDSGRRLYDLAGSLGIPAFSYRMVEINSMEEIRGSMFNVKPDEAVAVVAPSVFHRLLYNRILLESVVDVIKRLRPRVMVNIDVEADSNAPPFENRFVDVLFHCSACFDSFDVIMPDRDDHRRVQFEEMLCGSRIRNMIACEGVERRVRHVSIDVWRRFFKHRGLREKSFSYQAWYQAGLLLKDVPNAECYSLHANGYALISGWKTTPVVAVSLWTCS